MMPQGSLLQQQLLSRVCRSSHPLSCVVCAIGLLRVISTRSCALCVPAVCHRRVVHPLFRILRVGGESCQTHHMRIYLLSSVDCDVLGFVVACDRKERACMHF